MIPIILTYFGLFLWVYLLMMLLTFYETNKPYVSKEILTICIKQDISGSTWSWFAKIIKRWTSKLRVYYKRLEYDTISVIKNLTSRSSFISFGVLLFRPTLKVKFFVSQIKSQITFFHLAKTLCLIQHQVFIIWTGKLCHKIW